LSAENAAGHLAGGIHLRAHGGTYLAWSDRTLRDAINRGEVAGPRMQICGYYLTIRTAAEISSCRGYPGAGGQCALSRRRRTQPGGIPSPKRRKKRSRAARTFSKVIASGAVLAYGGRARRSRNAAGDNRRRWSKSRTRRESVWPLTRTARQSIKDAILAGSIRSSTPQLIDEEGIRLARERHVALSMDVYDRDYIDTEGGASMPERFCARTSRTEIQRVNFFARARRGRRHRFRYGPAVYPQPNARQFSDHGRARHDADAGHPVGDVACRALHGWPDRSAR